MLSHGDTRQILLMPGVGRGVLHDGDGRVRSRRAVPDARVRDERPRPRHEHLDVADRSPIPRSRSIAARCSTPRRWSGSGEWGRYKDVDGDGIPYRTIPGDRHAAPYFTRGSGHNERGAVQRAPGRLRQQRGSARAQVRDRATATCRARSSTIAGAEVGIIGYGTSHWAIDESRDQLRDEAGLHDRLPAAARVSVHGRRRRVHRPLQARLRRRAEPRRADAAA